MESWAAHFLDAGGERVRAGGARVAERSGRIRVLGDTDHYSLGRSGPDGQARTESFVPLHFAAVPCGIAVSGPYIYWGDQLGAIGRARIDGTGTPNLRFIVGATEPCGLTILAGRGDPTLGRFDSFAASWLHAARRDGPRPL